MGSEYDKKFRLLQKKLREKKISDMLDSVAKELGETISAEVSINITIIDKESPNNLDMYEDIVEEYENDPVFQEESMSLEQFIDFIDLSDKSLKVFIDPLHLKKKGINKIDNVIALEHEDKIIIVPKTIENAES